MADIIVSGGSVVVQQDGALGPSGQTGPTGSTGPKGDDRVTVASTAPVGPVEGDVWMDTSVAGVPANVFVSTTAPPSPVEGDVWIDIS